MIIKKGTQVKIITGKDKGKTGEILEINKKLSKIKVKSINMIKKHLKPTKENKGGCEKLEKTDKCDEFYVKFDKKDETLLDKQTNVTTNVEYHTMYQCRKL